MKLLILVLATGFGTGYSPKAPGTVGSALGVCLIFILKYWGLDSWVLPVIIGIPAGIAAAHLAEGYLGEHDSPKIVIDEIVGMFLAGMFLPNTYLIPAFLLFRFFDIVKPGPIGTVQRLPGGLGVMADDVLAGFMVWAILKSLFWLF
ncbi:MAG: phosphatidylglycerophosphatase A [Clostridia bacterium]|nr:phosphatidylglycerophosphatase A [Clostridia bacterium]